MRLLLPAVLFLLGACAQLEQRVPADLRFDLAGRLAVRYGDEAFTGNLAWRHAGSADEMLITSPLGAGVARLVRDDTGGIVLTTAEPREYRGRDAETLTQEVLGFRVPVEALADWVRGRPGRQARHVQYGDDGLLRRLEQGGWVVEYLEYRDGLPARMRLTYPGIELRLAISEWK